MIARHHFQVQMYISRSCYFCDIVRNVTVAEDRVRNKLTFLHEAKCCNGQ